MIAIVLMICSLFLDGILSNFLPYMINDLSYFTPMFSIVCIFICYPFYIKSEVKYYIILFIFGIIYDLFYTNLLFLDGCLFVILGYISYYLQKIFGLGYFKMILYAIVMVCTYEILFSLILFIYNMVPISISMVLYKIVHSLIINVIYLELLYVIVRIIPKKYKKISLN